MPPDAGAGRAVRVGAVVAAAIAVLGVAVFLIGEENLLFDRKARYHSRFESVSGLVPGGPVQLDGVHVGSVEEVVLPADMRETLITVVFSVERRYVQRLRADSRARIRTLGLLGDKYVAITSGDAAQPVIEIGGEVPAGSMTNVDQLMASGEDVVQNIVLISHALTRILTRMERGEGLLGELTVDSPDQDRLRDSALATAESVRRIAARLEAGHGTLGRLLRDDELATRLSAGAARAERLLTALEEGPGLAPALIADAATRQRFDRTLARLEETSATVARVASSLEDGRGMAGRLLSDEEYGARLAADLAALVAHLRTLGERLTSGDGSAARLINDPELYRAVEDILVGIDDSRILKRVLKNRRQAGERKRAAAEKRGTETGREPPPGGTGGAGGAENRP